MLKPLLRCRLCRRIALAVFGLIFAIESVLLVPSAQRFLQTERQRLADQAQILIAPLLARAAAEGTMPDLASLVGHYGLQAVGVYGREGMRLFHTGEVPGRFAPAALSAMAMPLDFPAADIALFAGWRAEQWDGAAVLASLDASALRGELVAHLLRIGGLVAIIVLFVTAGTMLVLDAWVLRPLRRLRESSLAAASDPSTASSLASQASGHGELGELIAAHRAMLERLADGRRRDREMAEERARFLTHHDSGTGLPNARALEQFLDRAGAATLLIARASRLRGADASEGSAAADRAMADLASRVRAIAAPGDFVARLGDERLALARGMRLTPADAAALAERLLRISPAVRVGIAKGGMGARELLHQAELALERTREGSDRYEFFSPQLAAQARERHGLAADLEGAMERGELFLAIQPKVTLAQPGAYPLAGAEALLRWNHPERGAVSPGTFVPLAEATGLILPIGEHVLRTACACMREWRERYGTSPRLAVNLSAQQFAQADLCERLEQALFEFGIPRRLLEVEITETSAMADVERTARVLERLRRLGVRVSIDDFGTGYSSLAYLRRFAVDAIKIDKSFVDDIGVDAHGEAICDAVLRLAQSLDIKVIAEGVEREEQAAFLRRRRCDEAQGYLFGKPMPAAEFEARWLRSALVAA